MGKVMSAKEAVMLVKGGDTIAVGGFVGCNHPEVLTRDWLRFREFM